MSESKIKLCIYRLTHWLNQRGRKKTSATLEFTLEFLFCEYFQMVKSVIAMNGLWIFLYVSGIVWVRLTNNVVVQLFY